LENVDIKDIKGYSGSPIIKEGLEIVGFFSSMQGKGQSPLANRMHGICVQKAYLGDSKFFLQGWLKFPEPKLDKSDHVPARMRGYFGVFSENKITSPCVYIGNNYFLATNEEPFEGSSIELKSLTHEDELTLRAEQVCESGSVRLLKAEDNNNKLKNIKCFYLIYNDDDESDEIDVNEIIQDTDISIKTSTYMITEPLGVLYEVKHSFAALRLLKKHIEEKIKPEKKTNYLGAILRFDMTTANFGLIEMTKIGSKKLNLDSQNLQKIALFFQENEVDLKILSTKRMQNAFIDLNRQKLNIEKDEMSKRANIVLFILLCSLVLLVGIFVTMSILYYVEGFEFNYNFFFLWGFMMVLIFITSLVMNFMMTGKIPKFEGAFYENSLGDYAKEISKTNDLQSRADIQIRAINEAKNNHSIDYWKRLFVQYHNNGLDKKAKLNISKELEAIDFFRVFDLHKDEEVSLDE
jgi:hypothetical protein